MADQHDSWLEGLGVTWFKSNDDDSSDTPSAVQIAEKEGDDNTVISAATDVALLSDEGAAPGGGGGNGAQEIADRIIAKIKADGDLRFDVAMLSGKDMRTLLDVMVSLKKAGKLEDFADRATSENKRIGSAIHTIRPGL